MCVDSWLPEKASPAAAARVRAAAASSRAATTRQARLPPFVASAVKWLIKNVLPKRKTLVRASLFAFIGIFPFLLILMIHRPLLVLPFLAILAVLGYAAGLAEETSKQLRWMRRMSGRGPIFWTMAAGHRVLVRVGRRFYGDKLDQPPKPPLALGTSSRGAERAKIKWIPQPTSSFSREKYEVQVRATALAKADSAKDDGDATERGWVSLSDALESEELVLAPLHHSTQYEARVRAVNSKGASEWRSVGFTTKQKPTLIDDGTRALARGDGYTWAQHLKDESIVVSIGPLPSSTRAKQLEVKVMPTSLRVARMGTILVSGDFYAPVESEETEWELRDSSADGEARELTLTLVKAGKKGGPFWPSLLRSELELDVSSLKRVEKDLDELMAEIGNTEAMQGMQRVQELKKEL